MILLIFNVLDLFFRNMIDNQIVISEVEKEKIMREHEKNMAEFESRYSLKLTLFHHFHHLSVHLLYTMWDIL